MKIQRSFWVAILTSLGLASIGGAQDASPLPAISASPAELVLLTGSQPARVAISVEIDGQPLEAAWESALEQVHKFCDLDGSGVISAEESIYLPTEFGVRQLLWGKVDAQAGSPPDYASIVTDGQPGITRQALVDWYRQIGVGNVIVGVGTAPETKRLTAVLIEVLDRDGNGRLTKEECLLAYDSLKKLDTNDDELVAPSELVAKLSYPGTAGTLHVNETTAHEPISVDFPVLRLPRDKTDIHWAKLLVQRKDQDGNGTLSLIECGFEASLFRKLDTDGNTQLSAAEFSAWRDLPPDAAWCIRFNTAENAPTITDGDSSTVALLRWSDGLAILQFRVDTGRAIEKVSDACELLLDQFANADTDSNGFVTVEEANAQVPSPMKPLLLRIDRDRDQQLSLKELTEWVSMQKTLSYPHVLLSILDQGAGLFEVLDADRDGVLSSRELKSTWSQLEAMGCVDNGEVALQRLPHQSLAVVSRGQPTRPLGSPHRPGPVWFNAMDRNSDGDISLREFTGPPTTFHSLDLDKDGLLSSVEAAQAKQK